ncbi:MAG: winged helix-turn-helix transcriptional regulator [Phycisphaerae bacterium]|nr:winged helix-turn-helix transcriptional regulator [Phycisphaerae bacterium]
MNAVENTVELLPDEMLQKAADCLKVMAHPIRLRMVNILMQGEYAVHEIAELCKMSANQTCEHLRLLKGHSLLDSQRRGRTVYYKIASPQLPGLIDCIKNNCQC